MAMVEEPVISRLDRLDNILKQLEMARGGGGGGGYHSPKSSTASTTSSQTSASDDFSPRSLEKHCRPIDVVRMETGVKGTVMERLSHIEDRLLKLEEEMEGERRRVATPVSSLAAAASSEKTSSRSPRKSLKNLVKSCVKGKNESNSKPWK